MKTMEKPESEPAGVFHYPKESTPEQIQTYTFEGSEKEIYDVYKVIALAKSLPEERVSVASLAEVVFSEKVWTDAENRTVSAKEVSQIIEKNKEANEGLVNWEKLQEEYPDLTYHFEKLQDVDYSTPIILCGDNTVVDGVHRLLKAWLEGVGEIKAKRFTELPESALLSAELLTKLGKN